MIIKRLELGPMANFQYLVGDQASKFVAAIDPGWETDEIISEAKKAGLKITHILLTHTHFDHVNCAASLAKKTGASIYVHYSEAGKIGEDVIKTEDGTKIKVGGLEIACLHTPGHSPGSQCFLAGQAIFTGDTLFVDGVGRTDLDGSDPEEMFKSLQKLAALPGGTIVYPGHNYGVEPTSSIEEQKKRNPYLKMRNIGEFLRGA